ncbi:hypothetical protein Trydic_g4052 [Trypoxylus dichotomus]
MLISFILFLILPSLNEGVRVILLDDDPFLLQCNYQNDCTEDIIFDGTDGYLLRIIVKRVDIDGANGDFLLVKSGSTINDGLTGRIFTHQINHERRLASLTNDVFVRFHRNEGNDEEHSNHTGISLTVQRFGSPDDIGAYNILPSSIIPEYTFHNLTVNMTIRIPITESTDIFRETVARMGESYVNSEENLILSKNISADDVRILRAISCPRDWPRSDTCFQIVFAFPISLDVNSSYYGTYQLDARHLAKMWSRWCSYFNKENTPDILIYDQLHKHNFIPWLWTILSITVLFAVFYMLIGDFCSNKIREKMFSRAKKEESNEEKPKIDLQDPDLVRFEPHPFQQIPPLFHSDVAFYEPDSVAYNRQPSGLQAPLRRSNVIFDMCHKVPESTTVKTNSIYFDLKIAFWVSKSINIAILNRIQVRVLLLVQV